MKKTGILFLWLLLGGTVGVSCKKTDELTKENTNEQVSEFIEGAIKRADDSETVSDDYSSYSATAETGNEVENINTSKPTFPDLNEIEMPEAIVVDDSQKDLWNLAIGSETDYPQNAADEELSAFYMADNVDNIDYVTPVKNQGQTALCWAYAAISAIESDLLKHNPCFGVSTLNLSEKHAAYYNMHKSEGSLLSGIDDDYREFVFVGDDKWLSEYDTGYISVGGVTDYCMSLFSAWKGPVSDNNGNSFKIIKGQPSLYTENTEIPSAPFDDPVCHVQGVFEVPATEKNRELIKRMIVEHGGVTASICADDNFWTGKKVALYDYKEYGGENVADHEVVIVGWDDEYSASHFITKPSSDGAFICKNSWGVGYGAQGYFYLSYEDSVLCNNNVVAYDCSIGGDNDWFDNNYQYAGFITHVTDPMEDQKNVVYMYDNNSKGYGIVISPQKGEEFCAVGYFSMSTNTSDIIEIYKMADNGKEYYYFEELGTPLVTMSCKAITAGYHTFSLEKPIDIISGEDYLVLVKPGNESKLVFEKAMDSTAEEHLDEWQHNMGAIHTVNTASGKSFLMSYDDLAVIRQSDKDFFVKAYTKEKTADGG